jgi:hypothetical protein
MGSHFGRGRLDLVLAFLCTDDEPHMGAATLPSVIGGPGWKFMVINPCQTLLKDHLHR